jgi:AraC-like DNA-binding protein
MIPLAWATKHSAGATRQGMDFESLMASAMIDIRHGDHRDMISPAQWLLLCMNTSMSLDDATHGLAREGFASGFTLVGLRAMRGCTTLEAAIRTVQHLYSLTSHSIRMDLTTSHDQAIISVEADCPFEDDRAVLEDTYLSWIYMHCMYYLGRSLPVIGVTTRDHAHFNMGHAHYAIGSPTRHGRCATLRFAKSLLSLRGVARADDNPHWECCRLWLDSAVANDAPHVLPEGPTRLAMPRISELALQSGVSRSTIYRRLLANEGGSRQQRQRVLTEAAIRLLRETDDSVEAIGAELGYSDGRSFRRFLKTATGRTPHELRRSVLTDSPQVDHQVRQRLRAIGKEVGY